MGIPDAHREIEGNSDDATSVGTEIGGRDNIAVIERLTDGLARARIPDTRRVIS
jgi:hypothetical protein